MAWLEQARILRYPNDIFNLRSDLVSLQTLIRDLFPLQTPNPRFISDWYEVTEYLLSNQADLAQYIESGTSHYPMLKRGGRFGNSYEGFTGKYPIPAALVQIFSSNVIIVANQMKYALICVAYHQNNLKISDDRLDLFADDIRKSNAQHSLGNAILLKLSHIPADSPTQWQSLAVIELNELSKKSSNEKLKELAHRFSRIINYLTSANPAPEPTQPPQNPSTSGLPIRRFKEDVDEQEGSNAQVLPLQVRIPLEPPASNDIDLTALEPPETHLDVANDILPDDLIPIKDVEEQQQRYTNHRTAVGNQRLPFAWDQLSSYEIRNLTGALKRDLVTDSSYPQSLLVALILLLGKPINEILMMPVTEPVDQDSLLISKCEWVRYIRTPSNAYSPEGRLLHNLEPHVSSVCLELPSLLKPVLDTLLPRGNLRNSLGISLDEGEAMVRNYLTYLRAQAPLRTTLGRVRGVLANILMQLSGDKTLVHLMTSLETEAPPSGVYYQHYRVAQIRQLYQQAIDRIITHD